MIIVGNPPFQNRKQAGKTQHKVWIKFTTHMLEQMRDGDSLLWVSPQSWGSPSNKILQLFKENEIEYLNLDTGEYFPEVGSTFSDYLITKGKSTTSTPVTLGGDTFSCHFDEDLIYVPTDISPLSLSIHRKVMFSPVAKLPVKYDYVTCHNVIRHGKKNHLKKISALDEKIKKLQADPSTTTKTLQKATDRRRLLGTMVVDISVSETPTETHVHPVLHTNNKIWYSSRRQTFADHKKVMWSRSGYTLPRYDSGILGGTDMVYYALVKTEQEGHCLSSALNGALFQYIFRTAKWSGFGNEQVFLSVPDIRNESPDDPSLYDLFGLTAAEREHVEDFGRPQPRKKKRKKEVRSQERSDNLGEVFTPAELVENMLDRLPSSAWTPTEKFVDPACGNGNFLAAIIRRKIKAGASPLTALQTTYGVDIMEDNVNECRQRLFRAAWTPNCQVTRQWKDALWENIRCANSLEEPLCKILITLDKPSSE